LKDKKKSLVSFFMPDLKLIISNSYMLTRCTHRQNVCTRL